MSWPGHRNEHAQAARKGWRRRVSRFGGSPKHTYKQREYKEKARAKRSAPARKAVPESFQYVGTQKSNGKWIVSKIYKSGKVVNSPKEYEKNPFPSRAGKKQSAPQGQGSLFGGTYHKGLFE